MSATGVSVAVMQAKHQLRIQLVLNEISGCRLSVPLQC
jgi:hypothetical protein